jgi:hypothetical protein
MVGEYRMMHLDKQCLGRGFTGSPLMFIPVSDRIGMMTTELLFEHLDLIVDAECRIEAIHGGAKSVAHRHVTSRIRITYSG